MGTDSDDSDKHELFTTSMTIQPLRYSAVLLVTSLVVGLSSQAHAGVIMAGMDFRPTAMNPTSSVIRIDAATDSITLPISDPGSAILDVNVLVNITKTTSSFLSDINDDGTTSDNGPNSFNGQIRLLLTAPSGDSVPLVNAGTFSGQDNSVELVDLVFDDSAIETAAGQSMLGPATPALQPEGMLSALNGQDPTGDWQLEFQDSGPFQPLSINAWELTIVTDSQPGGGGGGGGQVPEPTGLAIFGMMASALAMRKRRRG